MSVHVARQVVAVVFAIASGIACAQDPPGRKELQRADLSGAPGMEVVLSINEVRPGEELARHLHHGIEAGYVVEGAMIQVPGQEPRELKTGAPLMNLRDVPHAGYKVVGEKTLRYVTVHVVDKGKPLYEAVK